MNRETHPRIDLDTVRSRLEKALEKSTHNELRDAVKDVTRILSPGNSCEECFRLKKLKTCNTDTICPLAAERKL